MTAALCTPSGEVNIDLSRGDEQGLKNQTDVISSNQTFCKRTRISKHLGDSIQYVPILSFTAIPEVKGMEFTIHRKTVHLR